MTPIEVLDTAVKIGLGALITAGSSYVLVLRQARIEHARAKLDRRAQLLESVAESVQSFSHTFLIYWERAADVSTARRGNEELSSRVQEVVIVARESLFHAFESLNSAEARLLLLGEKKAQAALRALGAYVTEQAQTSLRNPALDEAAFAKIREEFLVKRGALFDELSQAYGSQPL